MREALALEATERVGGLLRRTGLEDGSMLGCGQVLREKKTLAGNARGEED